MLQNSSCFHQKQTRSLQTLLRAGRFHKNAAKRKKLKIQFSASLRTMK